MASNRFLVISLALANIILCVACHVTHEWWVLGAFVFIQVLIYLLYCFHMEVAGK